jgi:hypothetical protein
MQVDSDLVRDAAHLIALGLTPSKRPTSEPDYARLLRRWQDDPLFERVARDVAAGLGLRFIDVSDYGVTLGATPESPFSLTVADFRAGLTAEERLLHGLVQVALAAFLYPRAEDLEAESEVQRVSVRELESFLREACQALAAEHPPQHDPPVENTELEQAFRIYLRWPAVRKTADDRRAAKTTTGIIAHALARLTEAGLLRHLNDDDGGTYQALRRYRVQVRELAAHEALVTLRAARAKGGA